MSSQTMLNDKDREVFRLVIKRIREDKMSCRSVASYITASLDAICNMTWAKDTARIFFLATMYETAISTLQEPLIVKHYVEGATAVESQTDTGKVIKQDWSKDIGGLSTQFNLASYFSGLYGVFLAERALNDWFPKFLQDEDAYKAAQNCLVAAFGRAEEDLANEICALCNECLDNNVQAWSQVAECFWNGIFRIHKRVRMRDDLQD